MKISLTDASSAILLYKSDLFDTFLDYWTVVMGPTVYAEITRQGYPGAAFFEQRRAAGNFKVFEFQPGGIGSTNSSEGNQAVAQAILPENDRQTGKGAGEIETVSLFIPGMDGFILIDDAAGAKLCRRKKIPYINALLVPKLLYYSGVMTADACNRSMKYLCSVGYYSKKVQAWAFSSTRRDLDSFLTE